MDYFFQQHWVKENLAFTGYVHELLNYRYHWHDDEFEIDIILQGKAKFCSGKKIHSLYENDVVVVNPCIGHASLALETGSLALVIHFSANVLRPFLEADQSYYFDVVSNKTTRDTPGYCRLRFYSAQILQALKDGGPYAMLTSKASLEMLLSTLCIMFTPQTVTFRHEKNKGHQEAIRKISDYVENNYASKITLEDLSRFTQYNRTYISTIFKDTQGMNFYEYLTRVRFQHAIDDLANPQRNLTEIAINNGFSDLKTFNSRFRSIFQQTPSEYRTRLNLEKAASIFGDKPRYCKLSDSVVQQKFSEYLLLPSLFQRQKNKKIFEGSVD